MFTSDLSQVDTCFQAKACLLSNSSGYLPRRLSLWGQYGNWLARGQYAVTWSDRQYDLQCLSQCNSTHSCLTRSAPDTRCMLLGRQATIVWLLVGCLTFQQHASVSQRRIGSGNCTYYRTNIEVADQTFHLTQSQYAYTGPTSPITDPITPGAWQGSHLITNFKITGMSRPRKRSTPKEEIECRVCCSRGGRLNY